MARITYTGGVQKITGNIGNMVYTGSKAGIYIVKNKQTHVTNPNSSGQRAYRSNAQIVTKSWRNLTDSQRTAWNSYASTKPGGGAGMGEGSALDLIKLNGGVMSGLNAFLMTNQKLVSAGLVYVDNAPIGVQAPSEPLALVDNAVDLAVAFTAPAVKDAGAKVVFKIAPVYDNKLFHEQWAGSVLATAGTFTITSIKGAQGGDMLPILPAGFKVRVQAMTVNPNGTYSAPSNLAIVTVPAA